MSWLEAAPLPVLGVLILVLLLLGVEAGYRGQRWLGRRDHDGRPTDGQNHLLSAVLGLLALLLGFTFSLALNRYDVRRELVVQEANAIGTTWLRTQLLEEPNRAAMSGLLRTYVDARIVWSMSDGKSADLGPTDRLQQQLWSATGATIRTESSQQLSRAVMDAMNDSFDAASARAAERAARIPARVFQILLLYAVLSMVMLGYTLAVGGRPHRIATGLVLVLLSLAMVVILDLDRPRGGSIQVSQQPLTDLKAGLR
jgi:hypothetical protein